MTKTAQTQNSSTIKQDEIDFFNKIAQEWWDPTGKFKPLHQLNPVRIRYLRDQIAAHAKRNIENDKPFHSLSLLDIGCGGGLVCEPFARLGAHVTGVDAAERNIKIAKWHRDDISHLTDQIDYQNITAEVLLDAQKKNFQGYDVVFALEIIEHVQDVELFLKTCVSLTKKDGLLFISTLNRTVMSFLQGIIAAEYILRWLPKGTHHWRQFLKPSEIVMPLQAMGMQLVDLMGVKYNILSGVFELDPKALDVNYMLCFRRR